MEVSELPKGSIITIGCGCWYMPVGGNYVKLVNASCFDGGAMFIEMGEYCHERGLGFEGWVRSSEEERIRVIVNDEHNYERYHHWRALAKPTYDMIFEDLVGEAFRYYGGPRTSEWPEDNRDDHRRREIWSNILMYADCGELQVRIRLKDGTDIPNEMYIDWDQRSFYKRWPQKTYGPHFDEIEKIYVVVRDKYKHLIPEAPEP